MKSLSKYISESMDGKIYLDKFDLDFQKKMESNWRNNDYPPFRVLLGGNKLFSRYYTEQCYMMVNQNEGIITFVDRADFTSSIAFKINKSKLKSGDAITPDDIKRVAAKPASWGYLNEYSDEENVNACRVLTCLLYNHSIGKDINIPGIK